MHTKIIADADDELELEETLIAQAAASSTDLQALEAKLAGKYRLKALHQKMVASAVSHSQSLPFLATVELDLNRRTPLGLKNLFCIWLEKGTAKWLNPYAGLAKLRDILLKYNGDENILQPFIHLLWRLASEDISPASFVNYVMLPRMQEDYNWQQWQQNHLEALRTIADVIIDAKNQPPFTQEYLGSVQAHLAKDVVLVRYIGRPLAQYKSAQLHNTSLLDAYRQAWQRITFNNSQGIYFMRRNVLHFIYAMSGKIDLVQLVRLLMQLPEIERSVNLTFSQNIAKETSAQRNVHLFDYDIGTDLQTRRQHGYHSLDFTIELKAYLDIVKSLLEKSTGVYLCAYYVRLLRRYKDPVIASMIERLVRIIDDRGGMHIYKWHTKKLLSKAKAEMQNYVEFIEAHDGCDPEYPSWYLLFRNEETAQEASTVMQDATNLGLEQQLQNILGETANQRASYKDLLNVFIAEHPETQPLISAYQQQLLAGQDRLWTMQHAQKLDQLGTTKQNLHRPLLRSVIRGIGTGYARSFKSSSFVELLNKFGAVQKQKALTTRTQFTMPVNSRQRITADKDALARQQANLTLIEEVWQALHNDRSVDASNILPYINKLALKLEEPTEATLVDKVELENKLLETSDAAEREILEKELAKKDKTLQALRLKKQHYTQIMQAFETLTNERKFIAALILAGALAKVDAELAAYATSLLLQRYRKLESVASRLEFLQEDVSIDVLTYQQFTFLLNLLDTLFFALREDKKIQALLDKDVVLQEILKPYIITKKKQITLDALDAAAKKFTDYAALEAERAKWQSILDKQENKSAEYFHQMEVYISKTFIDSYYGDMGGICLSEQPQQILQPRFFVQRLVDLTDQEIIGMSVLFLSTQGFSDGPALTKNFWQAFAFNPLQSVLDHYNTEQQLFLYLQFRHNMEKLAWQTKLPVVLSGIDTSWGLISNNAAFGELIHRYETQKPTARRVHNAKGLSLYYKEKEFARALVIIDPRRHEQIADLSTIPTFYAHRELLKFPW
jgi:hypothetical protein